MQSRMIIKYISYGDIEKHGTSELPPPKGRGLLWKELLKKDGKNQNRGNDKPLFFWLFEKKIHPIQ